MTIRRPANVRMAHHRMFPLRPVIDLNHFGSILWRGTPTVEIADQCDGRFADQEGRQYDSCCSLTRSCNAIPFVCCIVMGPVPMCSQVQMCSIECPGKRRRRRGRVTLLRYKKNTRQPIFTVGCRMFSHRSSSFEASAIWFSPHQLSPIRPCRRRLSGGS